MELHEWTVHLDKKTSVSGRSGRVHELRGYGHDGDFNEPAPSAILFAIAKKMDPTLAKTIDAQYTVAIKAAD